MRKLFLYGVAIFAVFLFLSAAAWYVFRFFGSSPSEDELETTATPQAPSVSEGYFENALMVGDDEAGVGNAFRHYDGLQFTQVSIEAGLPLLPEGESYVAWLSSTSRFDAAALRIGTLQRQGDQWSIDAVLDGDFRTRPYVFVMQESIQNREAEHVVLRGRF